MLLKVKDLRKIYTGKFGLTQVKALNRVNFQIERGEFVSIMGESGSGKSTLLNLIAGFDEISEGEVILDGEDISSFSKSKMADFRRDSLGFIFQDFNLLDNFSNKDNILLPLVLSKFSYDSMHTALAEVAEFLSIKDILQKFPYEISGGERQRVAIARALVLKPKMILADEPTGMLDSKLSQRLMELFVKINRAGNTILMVTHSARAASSASRVLFLKDGEIFHQIYKGSMTDEELYAKIGNSLAVIYSGD